MSGALSDLGTVARATNLLTPSGWDFLGLGGGSEIAGISLPIPIPIVGNLFCFFGCGGSNDDRPKTPPHETLEIYKILGIRLIHGQQSASDFLVRGDDAPQPGVVLAKYIAIPFSRLPENVNEPPGNGFTEKKGPNYVNPNTGQSLHPDPTHPGAKGPHYDLHNGALEPKGKVSLRQFGNQLQLWSHDLWIEIEGPTLIPIE